MEDWILERQFVIWLGNQGGLDANEEEPAERREEPIRKERDRREEREAA